EGEGVHRVPGVDAGAEHRNLLALGEPAQLAEVRLVPGHGEAQLLAGAYDVHPALDEGRDLRLDVLQRGPRAEDGDVRLRLPHEAHGIAGDLDPELPVEPEYRPQVLPR